MWKNGQQSLLENNKKRSSPVISGGGTLIAGSEPDIKTDCTNYRSGDFITFQADTPHGWINGDADSQVLFVKATN